MRVASSATGTMKPVNPLRNGLSMASGDLIKASGKTLLTTAAVTGISFFTSVITARILGPEGRGLLSAAILIGTLAAGISQFGLANSFVFHRGAGRPFGYGYLLTTSLLFVCILAVLLAVMGLQFGSDNRLRDQFFLIAGFAGFLAAQNYLMTLSQLRAGLNFFNLLRFGLVFGNLVALLYVLAAFDSIDYRKILVSQLVVAGVLVFASLFWARRMLTHDAPSLKGETAKWRNILLYGVSHHGTVFLGIVLLNFDKIALLKIGTMVQYGFYALAFSVSRLIGAVQEAVSTALYARFAGRDLDQLSTGVKTAFRLTFLPMLVVAGTGALLSPWLIVMIFGAAFASMTVPFAILLFECVVGGASWILAQRFNAGGRPGLVFVRQFLSVLPIFIALPFLPQQNIHIYLSALMFVGAVLRLTVTLALYPMVLKQAIPRFLPTARDFRTLRTLLSGGGPI